jgi:hypothetical protein
MFDPFRLKASGNILQNQAILVVLQILFDRLCATAGLSSSDFGKQGTCQFKLVGPLAICKNLASRNCKVISKLITAPVAANE